MSVAMQTPSRKVGQTSGRRRAVARPRPSESNRRIHQLRAAPQRTSLASEGSLQHAPAYRRAARSIRRTDSLGPIPDHAPATEVRRPTLKKSFFGAFFHDFGLEKSFTVISFLTAASLIVFCGADLLFAWPFKAASLIFDSTFVLSGLALLGLTWSVAKDQVRGRASSRRKRFA